MADDSTYVPVSDPGTAVAPQATPAALTAALRWLPLVLIGAELMFVAINLRNYAFGYPSQLLHYAFYVDEEANIPTWFSSSQLLVIAVIVLIAVFADAAEGRPSKLFLVFVALGFLFLSVDEAATLHERFNKRLIKFDWMPRFSGEFGVGSWIVFYAAVGVAVILANLRNILACASKYRKETTIGAIGGAILVSGAVGAEIVGFEIARDATDLTYVTEVLVEEFLEMLGATVMLYAALLLLAKRYGFRL